ncbi:uncharacterized protein LOC132307423 isoform X2 [Cornus florida]|uniref:uncharacterized protein LOC132307423 isoform X2 n=1 Tax=Cornus florida TaxID=4283 RepID=UPI00289AA8AA|nr:uncharacterized protein LOC132307423 isoform X2 [Cornus florida]
MGTLYVDSPFSYLSSTILQTLFSQSLSIFNPSSPSFFKMSTGAQMFRLRPLLLHFKTTQTRALTQFRRCTEVSSEYDDINVVEPPTTILPSVYTSKKICTSSLASSTDGGYPPRCLLRAEILPCDFVIRPFKDGGSILQVHAHITITIAQVKNLQICTSSLASSTDGGYPPRCLLRAEILPCDFVIRPCEDGGSILQVHAHINLDGKDVFEAFYEKDLAKRLLLKTECGSQFTNKIESFKRVAMAVAPSQLGTFTGPKPLPGSLEALTLAPWICRSYGTHTGDDGSLSDLPNKPPYRCIKCWLDDRKRRGKFRRQNYTERKKVEGHYEEMKGEDKAFRCLTHYPKNFCKHCGNGFQTPGNLGDHLHVCPHKIYSEWLAWKEGKGA